MKTHHTDPYLLNPVHKVTVDLVGIGGTGSQMITGLARINEALMGIGHPGLHVRAWDDDIVTPANIARQLFSKADLGINKATVLVSRVNRFFGFEWESSPEKYTGVKGSNILITCVDSAAARINISAGITVKTKHKPHPSDRRIYWLDLGNLQKTGQVILGTVSPVTQPKGKDTRFSLPDVVKFFPQLKTIKEVDQGPSCSLAEALTKQDLFINSTLAQFGCNMIWKLIREGSIRIHGAYVNLETFSVNPIKIN